MGCKVLIYGYFGMGNTGDEAVLSVLINELRSTCERLVVLSSDPARTERLHGVPACKDKVVSVHFWRHLLSCSEIIFAGGGKYGTTTFRHIALLVMLAKFFGKSIKYRAVGFYPYKWSGTVTLYKQENINFLTRCMLKLALRWADTITVRDEYSKKFIEGYVTGRRVALELDLALKLKPDTNSAKKVLERLGLDTNDIIIGLNIRFLKDYTFIRVLSSLIEALDKYLRMNSNDKLLYIPFGYGSTPDRFFDDDIAIGRVVRRHLSRDVADRFYMLEGELKPSVILGLFKFLKAAICVRYHALVFAHMCNTPVLGIAYDTKIVEYVKLMSKLGREVIGKIIRPDEVSVNTILSFLRTYIK